MNKLAEAPALAVGPVNLLVLSFCLQVNMNASMPIISPPDAAFLGLAPFLRMSIAGMDLKPAAERMLALAQAQPLQAELWMNLSIIMQCLGQRELGLTLQAQALDLQRVYRFAARQMPVRCRLLMLMEPGDLAANTPLDCLLEDSDIELLFYYLSPHQPLAAPIPDHDALLVAMSYSDDNLAHLLFLEQALADWPQPVINAPRHIGCVDRGMASRLLQHQPGLLMPPTLRATRAELQALASGASQLNGLFPQCDFPVILRPLGSQGGRDLAKISTPEDIAFYLSQVHDAVFFISRFIDYSHADGFFRKMRVALIDGQPYACHMGVSDNWMIHYVNAGMYEEAWKRADELAFMTHFDDFKQRHQAALQAVASTIPLDYLSIDCAETRTGELLVFEVEHAMVIHAMDTEEQFPYKQIHMKKAKDAFRALLLDRMAGAAPPTTSTDQRNSTPLSASEPA
jgi:glutathione synthase/RimK-type ligase-like ATP-grasp enzyme